MKLTIPREYVIAARLADPTTRNQIDADREIDWSAVHGALARNRVPLNSLSGDPSLKDCPLLTNAAFQMAASAEKLSADSLRREYGELRRALLRKDIQSVLFKSSGLPPSFPYTSDNLDTLVYAGHAGQGRETLNALGYVELRNIEEPQKWLFRKFVGGKSVSAVHLHGVVGWGVPFLDDAVLMERVRPSEDDPWVIVPHPEDALLVTIAHAFYENKSFKLLDIARIRHCLHQEILDYANVQRIARERGWEDGLAFCLLLYHELEVALYDEGRLPEPVLAWARSVISADPWLARWMEKTLNRNQGHFPFRVSFTLSKILYYKKILRDSRRNMATRIYDFIATFVWGIKHKLQIRGQRGMIVSLSGIDGSGKTVHSRALQEAFEIAEVKARIYWSRFGSSAQNNGADHKQMSENHPSDIAASLARRRQRLQHPLVRAGWLGLNLLASIMRFTVHVRFPRWFGGVIICDRYIYDAMVEINASMPGGSRWPATAERLLALVCPRPDAAWLLDVSPHLCVVRQAHEKGGAATCEELSKQRTMFHSLATTYGLRVLKTDRGLEESSSQVVHETLTKYYEDYGTWVNALLLSNPSQRNPQKRAITS